MTAKPAPHRQYREIGPGTWTMLWRGLTKACPVCGQRGLFHWERMVEDCPHCGFHFERIEGHWIGAVGVNTIVSFGLLMITIFVSIIATFPDFPVTKLVILCLGVSIFVPLLFHPSSRTLWTAIDLGMRPLQPNTLPANAITRKGRPCIMTETFDLIIVGSGSGNSIPEHLSHLRIALIERGTFGGTCLNVGCIPSKMFVLPADLAHQAGHSAHLGIDTTFNGADWPAIRDRVFGRIDPITAGGEQYRASGTPNVTLLRGTAAFDGSRNQDDLVLTIVDGPDTGRTLSAPRYFLAAGARPTIPGIEGLDTVRYHTSDTVMRLDHFPQRLGVIGGGFIAAEMGHVFSGLGSEVHLFNRSDRMLRSFDEEIAERFTEAFALRVIAHLGSLPSRVEQRGDAIVLHTSDGEIEVDELLVAVGRQPNSDLLGVSAAGIATHSDGRVVVDDTQQTSVPGVYAVGDLSNDYQLKHLANAEAKVAFWNLANPDRPRRVDYRAVPSAVFSHPQVATVGLTERQARDQGLRFVVGRRDYGGTAYGWALEDTTSFAKVLVDSTDGTILGAHVMGPQASSIIQPLIQAMQFGQRAADVANEVFYIHPALTEVVENALLDAVGQLD